ncbi:MAG TPA: AAA family ATPase [Chloroflexi bacterium]|nr:AAA family ATPase [Chloroflexota bacterium]
MSCEWPEPPWVVPGLLPVGLTLLAGRPKVGKSWLALQLVQGVSTGGVFLGEQVEGAPCLYLALEDSPRRLADRMKAQGWAQSDAPADFVTVGEARDVLPLNGKTNGAVAVADAIREQGYKLVVIDTLSRAVSGDQNAVDVMTAALTPLQEAAHAYNAAVVLIDHHNKLGAANPYNGVSGMEMQVDPVLNILGSTGKAAMADCLWGLYKTQGKAGAILAVVGRDVEEKQLLLKHDPVTKCWQSEGDADAVRVSDARRLVWESVKELGETTCTELAEILGRHRGSVLRDLVRLANDGLLFREGNTFRATQKEEVAIEQEEKCGNLGNLATLATRQPWQPPDGDIPPGGSCQVAKVAKVATTEEATPEAQPPQARAGP